MRNMLAPVSISLAGVAAPQKLNNEKNAKSGREKRVAHTQVRRIIPPRSAPLPASTRTSRDLTGCGTFEQQKLQSNLGESDAL
jgi:hypothetical protein